MAVATMTALRRSVLYVPADNERALRKAPTLAADVIIVDLEDAVSPDNKDRARENVRSLPRFDREVVLRINGADTPWYAKDLAVARTKAFAGIVLPKTKAAMDVTRLATQIGRCIWPMMETSRAILDARPIAEAAAATGPAALVFGANDLAAELGITVGAGRGPLRMAIATAGAGRCSPSGRRHRRRRQRRDR